MKKIQKQKYTLTPWTETKKRLLADPETKKAYDALGFEFQIITALIKARAHKRLTQQQLADKIGVEQSALARFESGRIDPRLSFFTKVVGGLGLKLKVK